MYSILYVPMCYLINYGNMDLSVLVKVSFVAAQLYMIFLLRNWALLKTVSNEPSPKDITNTLINMHQIQFLVTFQLHGEYSGGCKTIGELTNLLKIGHCILGKDEWLGMPAAAQVYMISCLLWFDQPNPNHSSLPDR